jgi:hypothetical protein
LKASETKKPQQKSYCFHAIHSKHKTQECLEEALEGGKHVIPIPIEVLQIKEESLGIHQNIFGFVFLLCGVCWFSIP